MCFSFYLGALGVWRGARGWGATCFCSFPPSIAQKLELPKPIFFDILTIHNGQICYVKHVLGPSMCFSSYLGALDVWTGARGRGTTCLRHFPPSIAQKCNLSNPFFLILTFHHDQISYVKHVLDPLYVFFILFGRFGCLDRGQGLGHNLLLQFSTLYTSKMEISKPGFFFDSLTIHNNQISYVKHVLDPLYVFFILFGRFGCLDRGKGLRRLLLWQFSTLYSSKMEISKPEFF